MIATEPGAVWGRTARVWAVTALVVWGLVVGGGPLLLGAPGGDDAYYHAMRAHQHARCWRGGVPWPRWYPDLNGGLGGPEPRAYPVVVLAWHGVLALALDDAVAATSASTLLVPLVAGFAMLVALRRRANGPCSATAVAAAWAAAPYLLLTLHPRAALAEAWGLAVLPLVLEALLPPGPADRRQSTRAALWFALLVSTHLLVAVMASVIVGILQLSRLHHQAGRWALVAGGTGLLLAGASWLPSVAALPRLASDVLVAGDLSWDRHLLPGGVVNDPVLGQHLTLAFFGLVVAALLVALFGGADRSLGAAGLVALALCTPVAAPLYRLVPGLALLQFPWRWLGPAGCLVLLAVAAARRPWLRAVALTIVIAPLAVAPVWRWRLPDGPPLRPSEGGAAAAEAARRYGVPPILPSAPNFLPRGVSLAEALVTARQVRAELPPPEPAGPSRWVFRVIRAAAGEQPIPLLDGPGWQARVDGHEVGLSGVRSLVAVPVPAGSHSVELRQVLLVEDVLGLVLSAVGLGGVAVLARRERR